MNKEEAGGSTVMDQYGTIETVTKAMQIGGSISKDIQEGNIANTSKAVLDIGVGVGSAALRSAVPGAALVMSSGKIIEDIRDGNICKTAVEVGVNIVPGANVVLGPIARGIFSIFD
ncbi:unnamed protein product [Cyprideis torosa]|uniref:Uncharacterized protein n=1 Tax=Cyprideis torosa TaxID=163714 RepID=A0A7R8W6P7_9CRUS|nr:unnamed protein product [Cyprideis torosa]CAG0881985.1 unnamed protein product [Cyprideis torosa]